jgi:hypothetical protein
MDEDRILKPNIRNNGSVLSFEGLGQSCRASRVGPQGWCLLGNQTRDFVADFLAGILRPSQLGTATNKKPRPLGLGFLSSSHSGEKVERKNLQFPNDL